MWQLPHFAWRYINVSISIKVQLDQLLFCANHTFKYKKQLYVDLGCFIRCNGENTAGDLQLLLGSTVTPSDGRIVIASLNELEVIPIPQMYTIYGITSKQQEILNYKRKHNPWVWSLLPFLYSLVSGPEMMREYLVGMWVPPPTVSRRSFESKLLFSSISNPMSEMGSIVLLMAQFPRYLNSTPNLLFGRRTLLRHCFSLLVDIGDLLGCHGKCHGLGNLAQSPRFTRWAWSWWSLAQVFYGQNLVLFGMGQTLFSYTIPCQS